MTGPTREILLPGGSLVEVTGESHYLAAFEARFGTRGADGVREDVVVVLAPDPTNAYDPNAIKVTLDGRECGYMSRQAAVVLAPIIGEFTRRGVVVTARGRVQGGWDRGDGDAGDFGLTVDLADPDTLLAQARAL